MSEFVPPGTAILNSILVSSRDATSAPAKWVYFLHGILGMGANWQSLARRLVNRRPNWGAVLVDLRMHGRSQDAAPPHTLAAAAMDIVQLEHALGVRCSAMCAHSFGTKVALHYASELSDTLERLWLVDADPSPGLSDSTAERERADSVDRALAALESLPASFSGRPQFIWELEQRGLATDVATWLAMNLTPDAGGWRLRLDLSAIRALLTDYRSCDGWRLLERLPARIAVAFLVGERSPVVGDATRFRMQSLALAHPETRSYTAIPEARHWVHIDAPEPLVDQLAATL